MSAANEWQPIETAPKDGGKFLGFVVDMSSGEGDTRIFHWDIIASPMFGTFVFNGCFMLNEHETPTHWMPLPTPPNDVPSLGAEYPAQDLDDRWIHLGSGASEEQA